MQEALETAETPIKGFMIRQVYANDLNLFLTISNQRTGQEVMMPATQEGLLEQRLVIYRMPREFAPTPSLRDLDDVIDLAGAQLLGVVPEQPLLPPPGDCPPEGPAGQALEAIARRLLGERVPLTL